MLGQKKKGTGKVGLEDLKRKFLKDYNNEKSKKKSHRSKNPKGLKLFQSEG